MDSALPKVKDAADEFGFVAVAPQGFFGGPLGQSGWGWRPDDTEFDLVDGQVRQDFSSMVEATPGHSRET